MGIRPDGVATAGGMYRLTCTTVVVENVAVEPTVEWQFSNGSVIVGGNGISVGNPLTSGNTITLTLTFNPLRTSHGRQYICSANVTAKSVALSSNATDADIVVQSKLSIKDCVMWCCLHDYIDISICSLSTHCENQSCTATTLQWNIFQHLLHHCTEPNCG